MKSREVEPVHVKNEKKRKAHFLPKKVVTQSFGFVCDAYFHFAPLQGHSRQLKVY